VYSHLHYARSGDIGGLKCNSTSNYFDLFTSMSLSPTTSNHSTISFFLVSLLCCLRSYVLTTWAAWPSYSTSPNL
jgi:hypothetical protein